MMKVKKITAFILAVILIISLAGCVESEDFVVYERFKDNYTTDRFDVFCDWETINPLLDNCDFEKYGLYTAFFDNNDSFLDFEKRMNAIWLTNYSVTDKNNNNPSDSVEITYGAIRCNTIENKNHAGEKCFTEPMIQIHLYNPNTKRRENEIEPDYILGYRAVYSLDGELALEEGQWFLDEDKDEFCRHYFECMLKIIGKSK